MSPIFCGDPFNSCLVVLSLDSSEGLLFHLPIGAHQINILESAYDLVLIWLYNDITSCGSPSGLPWSSAAAHGTGEPQLRLD